MTALAWVGQVPSHWKVLRLKFLFEVLNGATPSSSNPTFWDGDIAWATPEDVGALNGDTLNDTRRKITEEGLNGCGTKMAPAGSIVITTRAPVGNMALAGVPLCTNQGCKTLVALRNDLDKRFFFYQLLTAKDELSSLSRGSTFLELSTDNLAALHLAVPPFEEQQHIAATLDRETARLDELRAEKEKFLELLERKRAALIAHAVTGRLYLIKARNDQAPRFKPSGIEWLGDVPEHWKVVRLKFVCRFSYGDALPSGRLEDGEIHVYGSNGAFTTHTESNTLSPAIVVGRKGSYGKINWTDTECFASDTTFFIDKRTTNEDLRWLFYALQTLNLDSISDDTGVPGLNREKAYGSYLPIPPLLEQYSIVAYLERALKEMDKLKVALLDSLELLAQRRVALIAEAVTGRLQINA